MKKFRFPLETLLRHRKNLEDRERTTLSQFRSSLRREEDHRQSLENAREETRREMAPAAGVEVDTADLQVADRYVQRLGSEISHSGKRIAALQTDVRKQTDVVVEASKRKKVLDTLKGKKLKQYLSEVDRLEQKVVDEIVVTRFAHKNS